MFDDRVLPGDVQKCIASFFVNPHAAHSPHELRVALDTFKQMCRVSRSFRRFAAPWRDAAFLRLFGLGHIKKAAFERLILRDLFHLLQGIEARSGLSGLQCLSDLVKGSLGETPAQVEQAFSGWIGLLDQHLSSADKEGGGGLFNLLPAVIAARLGQVLASDGMPPAHAVLLMKQLVGFANKLPASMAEPLLIEALVLARGKEIGTGTAFLARFREGGQTKWVTFGSADVAKAMPANGRLPADTAASLQAVAKVLALRHGDQDIDADTIERALTFLASCPYPLMGCLAQALDIIGGVTGQSTRTEGTGPQVVPTLMGSDAEVHVATRPYQ